MQIAKNNLENFHLFQSSPLILHSYDLFSSPINQTDLLLVTNILSSVQLLSHVRLFKTPWTAACQASLSITNSQSLPKLMSIELVMPRKHLILCRPLLLLTSIFPSISVFK